MTLAASDALKRQAAAKCSKPERRELIIFFGSVLERPAVIDVERPALALLSANHLIIASHLLGPNRAAYYLGRRPCYCPAG